MDREEVFDAAEFEARLARVRARMQKWEVDTIVLHHPSNIYYLCGHNTLNIWDYQCLVVPLEKTPFMVLWQFEQGRFNASATGADAVYFGNDHADPVKATVDAMRDRSVSSGRIGLEAGSEFLNARRHNALVDALAEATVSDATGLVEDVRVTKSPAEIEVMRVAAGATDAAMTAGLGAIAEGVDDYAVTAAMAGALIKGGTKAFSIFPMVAVGERSGVPHHSQNGKRIEAGETVFLECSPAIHWYHSPMMRTAVVGQPKDPFIDTLAETGTEAILAMMDAMKPGVLASDVAMAGSNVIDRIRDDILFHDFYGYAVGIGFPPTWICGGSMQLLRTNEQPLETGMTFHFPMTLRKLGEFGVGQSRAVVVTETGCEALAGLPLGLDRL